jgi:hypothetical protein
LAKVRRQHVKVKEFKLRPPPASPCLTTTMENLVWPRTYVDSAEDSVNLENVLLVFLTE